MVGDHDDVVIDGSKASVKLSDGIICLRWVRGAVIEERDALAALAALNRLCGGRAYPVLVEMAAPAWLSCKARKVLGRQCPVTRVALLGASPVDRVIVNFFVGERTPPRPTRFFTSREDALAWLRSSALAEADAGAEGIQDGNR